MTRKHALILVGGIYHDFEGYVESMHELFPDWKIEHTYDLDAVLSLGEHRYDLVISDTCFGRYSDGREQSGPLKMTDEQITGLRDWVRAGGAYMPYHSATVLGESSSALGELNGGVFVEHPPQFSFTVYPMYGEHPITEGLEAFCVHDELYKQRLTDQVDVHLLGVDRGTAFPLAWSKREGSGRVAHVALGHSALVWNHPSYRKLMQNTVAWLTREA